MPRPTLLDDIAWKELFDSAWDYATWRKEGQAIVDKDFMDTTPPEKQERVKTFLAGNRSKMDELDASFTFPGRVRRYLEAVDRKVHVFAIAEDWCPDVVRHAPVLQKMADAAPKVEVRYLMRSDRLDVFARYLTVGGEAVPKFVFFNEDFVECGSWGPMPGACRELIARGRACGDLKKAREGVSALYDADPDRRIVVDEFMRLIDTASCSTP